MESKVDFSELFRFLKKDDRNFPKKVEQTSESHSMSDSIHNTENVTSFCVLDSGDEDLVNILHDLQENQRGTAMAYCIYMTPHYAF